MTQQHIYHLNEQGQLEPMQETDFDIEDTLQELVAKHLVLLSGEQITPGVPRRWILIDREQGIPDIEGGSNRWALDHLLIDQDAIPTLVETKLAGNPEIRRAVVGQMMEYAAHARRTWNVERIRRVFEERASDDGLNPEEVLSELLQPEEDLEVEGFWQQVEINLRAANLRLLFVADTIPDPLARVVEFLNEQMPNIQVLAVEIKQFRGATGRTLVPRVIGRTAEAVAAPGRRAGSGSVVHFTPETLLESFSEEKQIQQALARLFAIARQHNARLDGMRGGISIRARCPAARYPRIAWLYAPATAGWMKVEGFIFGHGTGYKDYFDSLPPLLREKLDGWVEQFAHAPFAETIGNGHRAYAISHQDAAANIDLLAERLERVLRELRELPPTR